MAQARQCKLPKTKLRLYDYRHFTIRFRIHKNPLTHITVWLHVTCRKFKFKKTEKPFKDNSIFVENI